VLKKYSIMIKYLKKALQYCWYCKDEATEITILDALGKSYFLLKDMNRAKYYHFRCV